MKVKKISRSLLACLIVIAVLTGIVFAQVIYTTLVHQYHVSISAVGAIQVYASDGITVWSGYTFPAFNSTTDATVNFIVKNTGNTPAYCIWNITGSSWALAGNAYWYPQLAGAQLLTRLNNGTNPWTPITGKIILAVGQNVTITMTMTCESVAQALSDAPFTIYMIASDA